MIALNQLGEASNIPCDYSNIAAVLGQTTSVRNKPASELPNRRSRCKFQR